MNKILDSNTVFLMERLKKKKHKQMKKFQFSFQVMLISLNENTEILNGYTSYPLHTSFSRLMFGLKHGILNEKVKRNVNK